MNTMKLSVTGSAIAVVLAACGLLGATGAQATEVESHQFRYDPTACKTDAQDKIYIAFGRNVFALPTSQTTIIARDDGDRPLPPDPADFEGCPGHPVQTTDYGIYYAFPKPGATVESGVPQGYAQADLLELVSTHTAPATRASDESKWNDESFALSLAMSVCSKAGHPGELVSGAPVFRQDLPNGFTACDLKQKEASEPLNRRAAYIARPETYLTPLGRPFVVNCGDEMDGTLGSRCDVSYVLAPGLAVNYQFHPYPSARALPIDQVIAFDRGLRASIAATLVKNYPWRTQAADASN